jgi:hypothetical protein
MISKVISTCVIPNPDCRQVIPLCPEPILKQDGTTKNDCERNAFHRFLGDLKRARKLKRYYFVKNIFARFALSYPLQLPLLAGAAGKITLN